MAALITVGMVPARALFMLDGETYLATNKTDESRIGMRLCVNVRTGEVESLKGGRTAYLSDLTFAPTVDWKDRPIVQSDMRDV